MFVNKGIEKKLILLLRGDRWDVVPSFFNSWQDDEEMIDKVLLWGHFFLEHYFRDQSPEFHRELIHRFFSKRDEYTAAPRGFSKTTILQTCCDFSIVNGLDTFIVIIEKTFTEASEVIKGIADEFVDNEKILQAYGFLLSKDSSKKNFDPKYREAQGDVFINGVRLRGKGFNATVRGLKSRNWRPSRIICDDVEEDEHIENPEQRVKYEKNYLKGVLPAVDVGRPVKVFGTILHQDSLLNNLIEMHNGKIYQAHTGSDPATAPAESFLWPQRWSRESLIAKRNAMMSSGQSSAAYAQEYLNDPISDEERTFKLNWLWENIADPNNPGGKYRVPAKRLTMEQFELMRRKTTLNGYAMIDAADSTTEKADFTGAVVTFVDPHNNRYRVDVRREKRNIKGLIDLIFEVWEKWAPYGLIKIGIEKKALDDQVMPLFDEEKRRRQIYPVVEELKPMGRSKENRIKGALQGFYETGKIYSVGRLVNGMFKSTGDTEVLLEELFNFPSSKHDDLSDAEAYGGDIIVVPLADEDRPRANRVPQDDPFEVERNPNNYQENPIGHYSDPDPY